MNNKSFEGRAIKNKDAGFSVVEIVVVMAVIAILSALMMPSLVDYRVRAIDVEKRDDISALSRQLEISYSYQRRWHPSYPSTRELDDDLVSLDKSMAGVNIENLKAPGSSTKDLLTAGTSNENSILNSPVFPKNKYIYQPLTIANHLCTYKPSWNDDPSKFSPNAVCVKYNLFYYSDLYKKVIKISSRRQQ